MRSGLRDRLLSLGGKRPAGSTGNVTHGGRILVITHDEYEALEPEEDIGETSTKDIGSSDHPDGGAIGDVSEADELAGEQGVVALGL